MLQKSIFVLIILSLFLVSGCVQEQTISPDANDSAMPDNNAMNDSLLPINSNQSMNDTLNQTNPIIEPVDNVSNVTITPLPQIKEFVMEAKKWEFIPDTITVNKGDTVILHVTSTDVDHGFSLNKFGVSEFLTPGQTVDIQFVADETGTYTFFCNVFCGSGHGGMKGSLVVE